MGLTIHVDGGSRGNPGPAAAGVVIREESGKLVHEAGYFLGRHTNNAAEYHALIRALEYVTALGADTVSIHSDSELLVRQITGDYRVKSAALAPLYEDVQILLLRIPCWNIRHVRREMNRRADELANRAMDAAADVIVFDARTGGAAPAPKTPAAPADRADDTSNAAEPEAPPDRADAHPSPTARRIRVTVMRAPEAHECPAWPFEPRAFTIEERLPAGLCLHAAHALVPTLLAVRNTEAADFSAVPTLTVRCSRGSCRASFNISPEPPQNGAGR